MKRHCITAILAGVLCVSVAPLAPAEVPLGDTSGPRWQKPATLKSDAEGFVLGKDGQRLSADGSDQGYMKANADKTGFMMSAMWICSAR